MKTSLVASHPELLGSGWGQDVWEGIIQRITTNLWPKIWLLGSLLRCLGNGQVESLEDQIRRSASSLFWNRWSTTQDDWHPFDPPPSISRASSLWFQRLEEKRYRKELFYILKKKITKNCSDLFLPGWPSHILLWHEGGQELCGQIAVHLPVDLKGSSIGTWPRGSTVALMVPWNCWSVVSPLGFAGEFVVILGSLLPLMSKSAFSGLLSHSNEGWRAVAFKSPRAWRLSCLHINDFSIQRIKK